MNLQPAQLSKSLHATSEATDLNRAAKSLVSNSRQPCLDRRECEHRKFVPTELYFTMKATLFWKTRASPKDECDLALLILIA